jgi:hypothetical protein
MLLGNMLSERRGYGFHTTISMTHQRFGSPLGAWNHLLNLKALRACPQGTMLLGEKLSRAPGAKTRLWTCRALVSPGHQLPAGFGQNWPRELVTPPPSAPRHVMHLPQPKDLLGPLMRPAPAFTLGVWPPLAMSVHA